MAWPCRPATKLRAPSFKVLTRVGGAALPMHGVRTIIQCEQGAVEVSHGDFGAFSRLHRRSAFRGFVDRNHARHPVMLRFSFLCFLLEQSYCTAT